MLGIPEPEEPGDRFLKVLNMSLCFFSIISGDTSLCTLNFGRQDDENPAYIQYDHDVEELSIYSNGTRKALFNSFGYVLKSNSGNFADAHFYSVSNNDVDTGTETVDSFNPGGDSAFFWFYKVSNATNLRAGIIIDVIEYNLNSVEFSEESTADLGDTSPLSLAVDMSSGSVRLRATATTDNWDVSTMRLGIGNTWT